MLLNVSLCLFLLCTLEGYVKLHTLKLEATDRNIKVLTINTFGPTVPPGPLELLCLWKCHKYPKHVVSSCSEKVLSGGPSCVLRTHEELLFSARTYDPPHNGQEDGI